MPVKLWILEEKPLNSIKWLSNKAAVRFTLLKIGDRVKKFAINGRR
jgi:hypothetical protein